MLRYNILKALEVFKRDTRKVLEHYQRLVFEEPLRKEDLEILKAPRPSFILTPEPIICYNYNLNGSYKTGATLNDRIIYLYLAGMRNYYEYLTKGTISIPLEFSDIPLNKLKSNPLLDFNNKSIDFKFEHVPLMRELIGDKVNGSSIWKSKRFR